MEKYCEKITFAKKDKETKEELFQRVGTFLNMLLEEGYIAVVRYDEPGLGIVVIEFEHDEGLEYWGCNNPMWITSEEADEIWARRSKDEETEE